MNPTHHGTECVSTLWCTIKPLGLWPRSQHMKVTRGAVTIANNNSLQHGRNSHRSSFITIDRGTKNRISGASRGQCNSKTQKSTQYRDQQLAYCIQCEQQCDQRLLYVSLHRGPQPLATPDGLQPLPSGWHNHDTQTLVT